MVLVKRTLFHPTKMVQALNTQIFHGLNLSGIDFLKLLKEKKYYLFRKLCQIENTIKKSIILTGYAGYKELIKHRKILNVSGYTRMPGCNLTINQRNNIKRSFLKFKKKQTKFYKKFRLS